MICLPDHQLFCFSKTIPDQQSCRSNINSLIKEAYRINRNLGNVRAKRRDNGNNICVMTNPCSIIAPSDSYNPFGSLTPIDYSNANTDNNNDHPNNHINKNKNNDNLFFATSAGKPVLMNHRINCRSESADAN